MPIQIQQLHKLLAEHFALSGELQRLAGEIDLNYRLDTPDGRAFVLKVAHPDADPQNIDMQNALMSHLAGKHLDIQVPQVMKSTTHQETIPLSGNNGQTRLLTWVEGRLWADLKHHDSGLLASLGHACGQLTQALADFDHPAAQRDFKWNLGAPLWIEAHLHQVEDPAQRALLLHFIELYKQEVLPRHPLLRTGVHYNDANDHNILVDQDPNGQWRVTGLIDFGDAVQSHVVHEIAIAAAYACMDKPDFLGAAAALVQGFHAVCPLTEAELATVFPLIAMRLCVSVVNAAQNRHLHPDNAYLLISERPAWDMLERMRKVPPALAHAAFRHSGGLTPCPQRTAFDRWVGQQTPAHFSPVLDLSSLPSVKATTLDLSVGSTDLGHNANFGHIKAFERKIDQLLEEAGAHLGLGGYCETRPFYTSDAYLVAGNEGPRWRTVHLGLDLWAKAGTPVCAPLPGTVYSLQDNAQDNDYGPTIILRHEVAADCTFYTLYGHLTRTDLPRLHLGQAIAAGQPIAHIGPAPENGNWPPHLHFQVILDLLDYHGDFPGVAFPDELPLWSSICPDPLSILSAHYEVHPPVQPSPEALLHQRRQYLGSNLSLSYRQPLHIVRGYMQHLYDHTARRYLDTVNNVAHVGHQHPEVLRAGQQQMALLNTNTRYLHQQIGLFAEELLATFHPSLSVCYFVNSGSEANELALRMANTITKQLDIVALEVGYHGNTGNCVGVSSYKFDGKGGFGAPPHTHIVPMPDVYRGAYSGDSAGQLYAAHVGEAIRAVQQEGRGIAGFIAESILSCGGQVVLPQGYLAAAYAQVRAAGGLCIADEVQTGLGRVGTAYWAFELQGVVPDIVTIGKPLGNGHPVAAVVTTRAVADAFANGMEYFNTFGGNPVSCAMGRAVLRVLREEKLMERASDVGGYLMEGLRQLQARYPAIGDVRGHGLFLGFELVSTEGTGQPDAAAAASMANYARQCGILMSTDGPHHNVIKIKPPMCFGRRDADFLLEQIEKSL